MPAAFQLLCCPLWHRPVPTTTSTPDSSSPLPSLPLLQFDITLHKMPCSWVSIDAMDVSGELHLDVVRAAAQCWGLLSVSWITALADE